MHSITRHASLLGVLLVAAILLIVVGPLLVVRSAHDQAERAAQRVIHTSEVKATVQSLMYDLRNRESATLAYAVGHDTTAIRARLEESRREIPLNLAKVKELTRDNPEQQVRVGQLEALINQRGQITADILARPPGQAGEYQIEWLLDRNPLRVIGKQIADTVGSSKTRSFTFSRLISRAISVNCLCPTGIFMTQMIFFTPLA